MGYGFGIFLLAVGLILALAVQDTINNVDLTMVGWILALVGALLIVLTAVTLNRGRGARTVSTTTHPDHDRAAAPQRPPAGGLSRQDPCDSSFWVGDPAADNLLRLPCNGRGSRVPG
jgi:uncharacterized protein DUF6458